jgi:hypothetical protein
MGARPMEEYPELNDKSVVSMIFGGLLPKYYTVETGPHRIEYRKNMYSAAPGIWCSTGSVKNMLKLLPGRFVLDDGKMEEESIYYQEIYIARVMFYDGIYSGQEYKEKVLEVLGELIRAEIAENIDFELPAANAEEEYYRELWKCFYRTIGIKERYNPRCRMNLMPKRFWSNMTEMKEELGISESSVNRITQQK